MPVNTRREAYASIQPHLNRLQGEVLDYVHKQGGATCDEIEVGLSLRHQTASPRLLELERKGLVSASGTSRKTRSGRMAVVWVPTPEDYLAAYDGDRK